MARVTKLTPVWEKERRRWRLSIPPDLSPTKKRKKERFPTQEEAVERAKEILKSNQEHLQKMSDHVRPELIKDAVHCESICLGMGFASLREGFDAMSADFERRNQTITFADLLKSHESDYSPNWSKAFLQNQWGSFLSLTKDIYHERVGLMDTQFWRDWLVRYRKDSKPAAVTYNDTVAMVRAVFNHES